MKTKEKTFKKGDIIYPNNAPFCIIVLEDCRDTICQAPCSDCKGEAKALNIKRGRILYPCQNDYIADPDRKHFWVYA